MGCCTSAPEPAEPQEDTELGEVDVEAIRLELLAVPTHYSGAAISEAMVFDTYLRKVMYADPETSPGVGPNLMEGLELVGLCGMSDWESTHVARGHSLSAAYRIDPGKVLSFTVTTPEWPESVAMIDYTAASARMKPVLVKIREALG
eukprot:Sspe_Gene.103663::Locus_79493_Transcript_1_1_Confidence_1.000_Length_588::g.103663::m.103663